MNDTEEKKLGKINSCYEFEATEATLRPVMARFFLNFCVLFGESFRRPISDKDFWKDDFVPRLFKKNRRVGGARIRRLRGQDRDVVRAKMSQDCSFVFGFSC